MGGNRGPVAPVKPKVKSPRRARAGIPAAGEMRHNGVKQDVVT